jgi:AI-2 transport protein TqsA
MVSLFFIGVDYFVLWGLLAFLLNFIPTLGSILAAVPPVLLAIIQLGVPEALAVGAVFFGINTIIGNILEPRFMGKGLDLSSLVVFLSLVFWGWILGPVGMLLSVPLTMTVKIALENFEGTYWVAVMLGSGSGIKDMQADGVKLDSLPKRER